MGNRDAYAPGVFSWVDLATTDPEAAKQFYAQLFDWTFEDIPIENSSPYSIAFKQGHRVTALFSMPVDMREQNIPPHWQSYITVKDVDQAVQACQDQGGRLIDAPFDVFDAGRMAVIQDPTGAVVNVWQAKSHYGAELVNEVNTFCWAELQTRGADRAIEFYQTLFDWEVDIDEKPPNYVTCKVKGHLNCGIFDMDKTNLPPTIPCRWAVYFNVANLDAAMEKVSQLGGKVLMDPIPIDPGRFTTIIDPQGATLALIEASNPDD